MSRNYERVEIHFDARPYERSHMKPPRGRGMWAFVLAGAITELDSVQWFRGTFTEAKKQARAYYTDLAKKDGLGDHVWVEVLS